MSEGKLYTFLQPLDPLSDQPEYNKHVSYHIVKEGSSEELGTVDSLFNEGIKENSENIVPFVIEILPFSDEAQAQPADKQDNVETVDSTKKVRSRWVRKGGGGQTKGYQIQQLQKGKLYAAEDLRLGCEWNQCFETFNQVGKFSQHVAAHVKEAGVRCNSNTLQDAFVCLWRECDFECLSSSEMVRHVNFHTFHTKIKSHGQNMLEANGIQACTLNPTQRNWVPDLSAPFECHWCGCPDQGTDWTEVLQYYSHVATHAEESEGSFSCRWKDCKKNDCLAVSKLREHLRFHSQEKLVGCPNCGGLFANRIKFFDHCKRQMHAAENFSFVCSNCGKKFALERLLRDHMRSHINHYKCPECDMTCPTPSTLKNHINYKHRDVKPFSCEYCDYSAKTQADAKVHLRTHYAETDFKCDHPNCDFSCRSKATLKNHVSRAHTNTEANLYACHMCDGRYRRGAYLTKHLLKHHNFKWPSGHSRFRYNKDESTGLYRLQTIRFESVEVQGELGDGASLRIADDDTASIIDDPEPLTSSPIMTPVHEFNPCQSSPATSVMESDMAAMPVDDIPLGHLDDEISSLVGGQSARSSNPGSSVRSVLTEGYQPDLRGQQEYAMDLSI